MAALGIPESREMKNMYLSPFREESSPSLHADPKKNLWYDHGEGSGGTVVDLVMRVRRCEYRDALKFLSDIKPDVSAPTYTAPEEEKEYVMDIVGTGPLYSYYLEDYIVSRGINLRTAHIYCREIKVRNTRTGKTFTHIGFKNNAGGYALKSPSGFKSTTKSGITTIDAGGAMTTNPSRDNVAVFEGFFDFLAWMTLHKKDIPPCDVVVLNSVNNVQKAMAYLGLHKKISLWLDNDEAGRKAVKSIQSAFPDKEIIDRSGNYSDVKDVNDWLLSRINRP